MTARDINAQADAYKQFREHIKRMHKLQEEMIWNVLQIECKNRARAWLYTTVGVPMEEYFEAVSKLDNKYQRFAWALKECNPDDNV